jgi:hypothetical protein
VSRVRYIAYVSIQGTETVILVVVEIPCVYVWGRGCVVVCSIKERWLYCAAAIPISEIIVTYVLNDTEYILKIEILLFQSVEKLIPLQEKYKTSPIDLRFPR